MYMFDQINELNWILFVISYLNSICKWLKALDWSLSSWGCRRIRLSSQMDKKHFDWHSVFNQTTWFNSKISSTILLSNKRQYRSITTFDIYYGPSNLTSTLILYRFSFGLSRFRFRQAKLSRFGLWYWLRLNEAKWHVSRADPKVRSGQVTVLQGSAGHIRSSFCKYSLFCGSLANFGGSDNTVTRIGSGQDIFINGSGWVGSSFLRVRSDQEKWTDAQLWDGAWYCCKLAIVQYFLTVTKYCQNKIVRVGSSGASSCHTAV